MANSPRTAAPCSASTAAFDGNTPTLPAPASALMPLSQVRDTLNSVDSALHALRELLAAAHDSRVATDGLAALLAPLHQQLTLASCSLNDLPLVERTECMRPMAHGEVLLSIPKKLTYEFFTTCSACALEIRGEGFTQTLRRFHRPLNSSHASYWNHAHWNSNEERTDNLGQSWVTHSTYITNDFGQLVALEGGAA